uniref:NADH-ubiquinone oxidoreductase chain 6 n=1 Tax=Lepisma saccharinum TaxID=50586 RepID=A0A6H1XGU0_LEPSA|nr:NADH dehydrogenase subunit 6 [Lepisma saccharinum]QJA14870.1 NADH dehydrogenase subunit 6 [Lepisma saccharinum]
MLMLLLITSTIIMTQLNHPLAMGLSLIINTSMTCLVITTMTESPWFSYILFLVFLGGMLVLFIYVTSLASNELFHFNSKMMMFFLTTLCLSTSIIMLDPLSIPTSCSSQDSIQMILNQQEIPAMKFYNSSLMIITLTLVTYLFITLVAVVKVTNLQQGPLRMTKT